MLPELSSTLSWWQWAIFAIVPAAIVLLYFLKLQRRPVEVPSTYLWQKSIEDLHVNSIWQRLRNNLLLYLQLAVVLFIALALLRPGWHSLGPAGSRLVLLIDNSASMQATDVKPNRLEEAKRRAGELIDQMRGGDMAMLISFADTACVEQNLTGDRRQLRQALAAIRPTQRPTSLSEALKLVAGLAGTGQASEKSAGPGRAETRLFVFSDGRFPPVPGFDLGNIEPTFVPIGRCDAANVGIVAFGVARSEDKARNLQAFARLSNCGPATADVLLKLFVNNQGRASDAGRLSIPPGQTRGLAFDLADFESGVLHLRAETGDQLAMDDEAWAVVNLRRRARVLLVTPGNERLEQALTTKAAAEMAEVCVRDPGFLKTTTYRDQAELGGWDLVVYDQAEPAHMPQANTFFIGCLPPDGGWKAKAEVTLPQIVDTALSHRLMQWVDLNEIQKVVTATPLVVPGGGTVLVDTDAGPLLALAPREGFNDLVLGMALVREQTAADGARAVYRNTDWPWRASFASLVFNLLAVTASDADPAASAYRPGMPVSLSPPDSRTGLDVQSPSGVMTHLLPDPAGKLTFTATEELGVYQVLCDGKPVRQFAVNLLDPAESDIRPPLDPAIKIGYVEVAGTAGRVAGHREIWRELVLVGLAIALLEWLLYLRRLSM